MLLSVLQIVVLPVVAGTVCNSLWGARLTKLKPVLPAASVVAITLIIGAIVAVNRHTLVGTAGAVVLGVALHNASGLGVTWLIAQKLRLPEAAKRTLVIEVGMQNSGLAVALAKEYFTALAALPGAVFSIWHNLTGSLLAARWAARDPNPSALPGS
jgi:BASS family bile acid:Na+ symporter